MTLQDIENAAKRYSEQGMRLRLVENKDGWEWQWQLKGLPGIFNQGFTTAQSKPIALAMALNVL